MTPLVERARNLELLCAALAIAFVCPSFVLAQEIPDEQVAPPVECDAKNSPFELLSEKSEFDLEAAVEYFEDMYRSDSSISEAELTVTKPRRERTLRMKAWTSGQEKALIVIQSPAREQGTATLKVGNNLWNYLPRIKRTIRVPPSMMLGSWMGSDFTNDDLVRESSFKEDYAYGLEGRSEEPAGWLIRFDAKPDLVGLWNRIELVVSEDGHIPLQARYYDRKDRLSRTIYWSEVKEFDGKNIPSRMTIVPETEEDQKTEMVYFDIRFDVDIPESTFSLSKLEQKR